MFNPIISKQLLIKWNFAKFNNRLAASAETNVNIIYQN